MLLYHYWEALIVDLAQCCVCLNTLFVGRGGGDDVGTWIDGTPGQIEGGSFGRDFPLTFISSKPDGQCNAQTTVSLVTLKLALSIALIHFSFSVSSFGKRCTNILSLFNFSEE